MTTYPEKKTCALCGAEHAYEVMGSAFVAGSPDLDTRQPETGRSALFTEVQRCPGCGYCAADVSEPKPGAETMVKSLEYRRQLDDDASPYLANEFLCMAMVNRAAEDYAGATWALIRAAWVFDDENGAAEARMCRSKAADMIALAEEHGQSVAKQEGASTAILVEVLRRSGRLDDARNAIARRPAPQAAEVIVSVLQYQERLIEQGDTDCHTIADAFGDDDEPEGHE